MSQTYCYEHDEMYDTDEHKTCPLCDEDFEAMCEAERAKAELRGWADDIDDTVYETPRERAWDDYGISQKDFI